MSATGSRNGNLQITQFYYGAAQPSNAGGPDRRRCRACSTAHAQDDGFPQSDPNVSPGQAGYGNLGWINAGPERRRARGVATDQTRLGHRLPDTSGPAATAAQHRHSSRSTTSAATSGLLQRQQPAGGSHGTRPAVAVRGRRQLRRQPALRQPDPDQLGRGPGLPRPRPAASSGARSPSPADPRRHHVPALAYGAPDPGPQRPALDNFIYVGTHGGHIFVTLTGGGVRQHWTDISGGLDGIARPADRHQPDPGGSHEAYAVTRNGVYHMADSSAAGATWTQINGPTLLNGNPAPATSSPSLTTRSAMPRSARPRPRPST